VLYSDKVCTIFRIKDKKEFFVHDRRCRYKENGFLRESIIKNELNLPQRQKKKD